MKVESRSVTIEHTNFILILTQRYGLIQKDFEFKSRIAKNLWFHLYGSKHFNSPTFSINSNVVELSQSQICDNRSAYVYERNKTIILRNMLCIAFSSQQISAHFNTFLSVFI